MDKITLATLISFFVAVLSTSITIKLARKFGIVDDVRKRPHPANTHKGIIPRAGGLPIIIAVLFASLFFININKLILGILIGSVLIFIIGILDDIYDLSPYIRFISSILIIIFVVSFGLGIPYITSPLGGVIHLDQNYLSFNFFGDHTFLIWANLLSVFWILLLMNIVSWSSGVDGQLSGFVMISCFVLGLLALRFSAHDINKIEVAILAFIVGSSYMGFLPWNFYPQKIMPGYSGGALAGYFLGVLSILSWGKIGTLVLLLSIPLIDSFFVLSARIKNKKSPFKGDANHFHHRLLKIGWGRRRIAVFYWIVSLVFGLSALFMQSDRKYIVLVFVFVLIGLFIIVTNKIRELHI
ncbi:MAG: hypothetical protein A3J62_02570 [Candidatus Buchananbacteria bacterium RIFCSPHIGHO2_02_FULL_38_8]|uniref:Undecaprenyl-phosphate alpha-N-acetylglucosaminyl 1-phosphate transferase n=1 Tax=Candidatus Buchananbacteria bacterium RIFCSPHIGHO2_02_FULL_38_8 TaxID=1797538 RepID=A0A1G1Y699_9BACT|nr:MAG: hypothetical protein A3J62_02570 [Candidatus Buchananbacteria bacterium RIFCSPHIGHO2_02_FULL_38_8]